MSEATSQINDDFFDDVHLYNNNNNNDEHAQLYAQLRQQFANNNNANKSSRVDKTCAICSHPGNCFA